MSPFPHRKKNVTISVRCGARCRAYHASSMGEGKGPPHNCAPARFLFFGLFSSRRLPLAYKEFPAGPAEPPAVRTWCVTPRKALILRPEAPRRLARPSLRRPGRGASRPAKPFTSVGPRQPDPDFPGPPAPLLASPSPQNLNSPSGHANLARSSLRQFGFSFSYKKRMRRTYII